MPANDREARSAATKRRKPKRAGQLGISDEGYARLLQAQGGVCAICGAPPKTRRLSVDHNHRTGRVRGLLCFRCNRNLPTYATSEWLRAALAYVLRDEYPERSRTPSPDPDEELDQWADAR
jgi:Recombination endonuclease VII